MCGDYTITEAGTIIDGDGDEVPSRRQVRAKNTARKSTGGTKPTEPLVKESTGFKRPRLLLSDPLTDPNYEISFSLQPEHLLCYVTSRTLTTPTITWTLAMLIYGTLAQLQPSAKSLKVAPTASLTLTLTLTSTLTLSEAKSLGPEEEHARRQ